MAVSLKCPKCRAKLTIPDRFSGRGVVCPLCSTPLKVQQASDDVYQLVPDDSPPPSPRRSDSADERASKPPVVKVVIRNVNPPAKNEPSWIAQHALQLVLRVVGAVAAAVILALIGLPQGENKGEAKGDKATPPQEQPQPAEAAPQPPPKQKAPVKPPPVAPAAQPNQFLGRWRFVNERGVTASYLTVNADHTAKKDHAPDTPGKWEIAGNEARIRWDDGFWDILRSEGTRMTLSSLGQASSWDAKPGFQLRAVRVPSAQATQSAVPASQFIGRWKIVNDKGVVTFYLTLSSSFGAIRDHDPDPGRWVVVGNEARISWDKGYRDILRLEAGKATYLGVGQGAPWDKPPDVRSQAVRIRSKR